MNDRIKRFNVGDVVIDLNGRSGRIKEAHCDPHPRDLLHCSGNSARYLVNFENQPSPCTRWDWQLSPPNLSWARTNDATVHVFMSRGEPLEQCVVALVLQKQALEKRVADLELIAPKKMRFPDGSIRIYRAPDHLLPDHLLPDPPPLCSTSNPSASTKPETTPAA